MSLRIMTWNIKGESSLAWNNNYTIKNEVVEKIQAQKADVIVLTAFVVAPGIDCLFNAFREDGYIWFQQSRTGKNGILIAIKRNLINEKSLINQIYSCNAISSELDGCNILKILFPLKNNKKLGILGCRLETGAESDWKKLYDSERKSFEQILIPHINEIPQVDYCIVCGDFNNARCLGSLNKKFDPQDYEGKAQINYNLNIVKDKFDELGFAMADCIGGSAIATHKNFIPDDHIFVKGFSVFQCEPVNAGELSDHDILMADCNFE